MTLPVLLAGLPPNLAGAATTGVSTGPSMKVSQVTGLRNGQIVTVVGAGLAPNRFYNVLECPVGFARRSDCAFENSSYGDTGDKTTFRTTLQVLRAPFGKSEACTTAGRCVIAIVGPGRAFKKAVTGITVSSTLPPVLPRVVVSQRRNLTPNQFVTITGSGFAPSRFAEVIECSVVKPKTPLFEHCAFGYYGGGPGGIGIGVSGLARTSSHGTFHVRMRVNSEVLVRFRRPHVVNCESGAGCELSVSSFDPADPNFSPDLTLGFNRSAKPITPVMTLSATAGLADGQMVTVQAGPFLPDEAVGVRECPTSAPLWRGCRLVDATVAETTDSGQVSLTFPVVEKSPSGKFSCAVSSCSISVIEGGDIWYSAWTPISFDASLPAIRPTASVTPSTSLQNGSLVTVEGSSYAPGAAVDAVECFVGGKDCNTISYDDVADASGNLDFGVNVMSSLTEFEGGGVVKHVPCGQSGCVVRLVNSNDPHQSATVHVGFAAG